MVKPVNLNEQMWRVQALLRRDKFAGRLDFKNKTVYGKGVHREVYGGYHTLFSERGVAATEVQRAVDDLIKAGYLAIEQHWRPKDGRSSFMYTILFVNIMRQKK